MVCCTSGQRAGLQLGFGDDPVDDAGLDLHADRRRRKPHGVRQLVRRHRPERDRPTVDRVVEAGVGERPVEVVGPQRGDEANGRVRRPCATSTSIRRNARRSASSIVCVNSSSSWSITMSTPGCPGASSSTTASSERGPRQERPDDVGKIGAGDAPERRGQLLERLAARAPSR